MYACNNPANASSNCSHIAASSWCGVLQKAPYTSTDMIMNSTRSMSAITSCMQVPSSGDLCGIAPT